MGKKSGKKEAGGRERSNIISGEEKYQVNSLKDLNLENLKGVLMHNRYAQMLILLVIAGFVLRFYNLGFNSIWLDEGSTLGFAKQSLSGIWAATSGGEFNPPLFYYMEHFMLVFGDSEFTLRFLPALFGSLTVPVMYLIGREISGRLGGIIAAALMAFSTFHIFYSQDARAYTTMLFFFSIAVFFYLLALKSDSYKDWICFGVFSALSFWTHFYVFVAIGILILHALIVKRELIIRDIKTIKPVLIGFLSFLIVALPIIYVTVGLFFKRTSAAPTWGLSGVDVFTSTLILISGSEIYLTLIFSVLAVIGIIYLFINEDKRNYAYLIILSLILPFIVSIILSSKIPMSPRYLIYILPFYFTAIGAAFGFVPKDIDYRKVAAVAMAVLFIVSIPYFTAYYTSYSKNDWRGFSGALSDITEDGDYVVVMPGYMRQPLDYYYDSNIDGVIELTADDSEMLGKIELQRGNTTAYYVVTWDLTAANPEGDALLWLNTNTLTVGQYMGIYLLKSK